MKVVNLAPGKEINTQQLKELIKQVIREENYHKKLAKESLEDLDTNLPSSVERYLDKMVSQIKGMNLNRKKEMLVLAKVIDAMGMDKQELMRYIQQIKKKDILGK
jgi:1,2-phenylacetyl-CoA epoxidase catalytic subunit